MISDDKLLETTPLVNTGIDLTSLSLNPKEGFLLSRIDGHSTLKTIIQLCHMDKSETMGMIKTFLSNEIVLLKEYTSEEIKTGVISKKKRPPKPPAHWNRPFYGKKRSRKKKAKPKTKPKQPSIPEMEEKPDMAPPAAPIEAFEPKDRLEQPEPETREVAPPVDIPSPTPPEVQSPIFEIADEGESLQAEMEESPPIGAEAQGAPPLEEKEWEDEGMTERSESIWDISAGVHAPSLAEPEWDSQEPEPERNEPYEPPRPPAYRPPPPTVPMRPPPRRRPAGPVFATPVVDRNDVVEDLSDKVMAENFNETPYPALLAKLYIDKESGILHIYRKKGGPRKEVYLRSGVPVFIAGDYIIEKECLGRLLKHSGKISDYDLKRSLEKMKETRDYQGQILLQMGAIDRRMLKGALKWQLEIKLAEIFTWKMGEGLFEFYRVGAFNRPIDPVDVNLAAIILRGIKRGFPFTRIQARLKPNLDKFVVKRSGAPFDVACFKFQLPEERLWEDMIDGCRTAGEIIDGSRMDRQHVMKFLYALECAGMASLRDNPAGGSDEEKIIEDLKDRLRLSQKGHYFDALGIHWTAVGHKVREGWEKIQRQYGPKSKIRKNDSPEIHELADKILEIAKTAYERLLDDRQRKEYRKTLFNDTKLQLTAELLYQQAESQLLLKDDFRGALENLECSVEVNPQNWVVQAAYGTALIKRHYPNEPEKYRKGEKVLKRALNSGQRRDMVHFYAGHAYWTMGRSSAARSEFETAIRLDPNNHDARKALRAMSK